MSKKEYIGSPTKSSKDGDETSSEIYGNGSINGAVAPSETKSSALRAKEPKPVKWSPENENILVEWCDIAQCYKWLHTKAHAKYSRSQACYTIPAIILSTISGTASFAQTSVPESFQVYAPMVIGSINIFIGILTTIQQYLKISELNEGHRVSAISWDKFARNIRIELAKDPDERMKAEPFLKMSRQEFDRLMETSPSIPPDIVAMFMKTFGGDATKYQKERIKNFEHLIKPDVCDIIVSSAEKRHHWYKDTRTDSNTQTDTIMENDLEARVENDILEREEELRKKEQEIHDKELEMKREVEEEQKRKMAENLKIQLEIKRLNEKRQEEENYLNAQMKKIDDYVKMFSNVTGRKPLSDELSDNFTDKIEPEILARYLNEYLIVSIV